MNYEAVVVFDADLDEAAVLAQIEKIGAIIKSHSGELTRQDLWGRRQLGYLMQKKSHGIYTLLEFSGDNSLVKDLERQLGINESVLRNMVVKKDKYAPDLAIGAHPDESFNFGAPEIEDDSPLGGSAL